MEVNSKTLFVAWTSWTIGSTTLRFTSILVFCLLIIFTFAAVPETPRGRPKTIDCNGAIAFFAVTDGSGKTKNKPISFSSVLTDKAIGYNSQTGVYTNHCPGIYQFNFAGSGDSLKLSLRRRPSSATSAWSTVIETGLKGGSQTAILSLEVGEEVAIFLDTGAPSSTRSQSFSGFRISVK